MLVPRRLQEQAKEAGRQLPVLTMVGPRQAGKTTLVKMTFPGKPYCCLENPDVRAFANNGPRGFLASVKGGAILDEIQRAPDLLSCLQGMVDNDAGISSTTAR